MSIPALYTFSPRAHRQDRWGRVASRARAGQENANVNVDLAYRLRARFACGRRTGMDDHDDVVLGCLQTAQKAPESQSTKVNHSSSDFAPIYLTLATPHPLPIQQVRARRSDARMSSGALVAKGNAAFPGAFDILKLGIHPSKIAKKRPPNRMASSSSAGTVGWRRLNYTPGAFLFVLGIPTVRWCVAVHNEWSTRFKCQPDHRSVSNPVASESFGASSILERRRSRSVASVSVQGLWGLFQVAIEVNWCWA